MNTQDKDTTLDELVEILISHQPAVLQSKNLGQYRTEYKCICGFTYITDGHDQSEIGAYGRQKRHEAEALLQWRDKAVVEAELLRFQYEDWEVGDDDKLRLGDFINCNHQRGFDGYEQNFEGQIVKHHGNEMPVVIYNVDPKDPDNSGDYATLQDMYMQGWTFSRLAALKETPNED